jgi:uncharacterized protein (DUF1697 family)
MTAARPESVPARRHVLLLRGVNVGPHKRVPMAELRRMLEGMGYTNVRTLLNSGNAVFDVPRSVAVSRLTSTIGAAIEKTFGFSARPFVLTSSKLDEVIAQNTLAESTNNASRLVIAYFGAASDQAKVEALARRDWGAEALAIGTHAAYVWCPNSILESPAFDAVARVLGDSCTTRNWATTLKLQASCRQAAD